jgi:capsule polysaccharide export protein KpsE/RkpR
MEHEASSKGQCQLVTHLEEELSALKSQIIALKSEME